MNRWGHGLDNVFFSIVRWKNYRSVVHRIYGTYKKSIDTFLIEHLEEKRTTTLSLYIYINGISRMFSLSRTVVVARSLALTSHLTHFQVKLSRETKTSICEKRKTKKRNFVICSFFLNSRFFFLDSLFVPFAIPRGNTTSACTLISYKP